MIEIYNIKVNGKKYQVEVEQITQKESEESYNTEKNLIQSKTQNLENYEKQVIAPLQGNILNIKVNKGDEVKKGQILLYIEAMKLENEILSNYDAKVKNILVNKGDNVDEGDILIILE